MLCRRSDRARRASRCLSYNASHFDHQCRLLERSLRAIFERCAARCDCWMERWSDIGSEAAAVTADRLAQKLEAQSYRRGSGCHRPSSGAWHAAYPARARIADAAHGAAAHCSVRSRAPAARDRAHRSHAAPLSAGAPSGVLRHGISSRHACRGDAVADSSPLRGQGSAALWFSWAVLHFSHAGTESPGRPCSLARARDPGAPGQRRQSCGRARRPLRRYQHGVHAGSGSGDGDTLGRFGSGFGELF